MKKQRQKYQELSTLYVNSIICKIEDIQTYYDINLNKQPTKNTQERYDRLNKHYNFILAQ